MSPYHALKLVKHNLWTQRSFIGRPFVEQLRKLYLCFVFISSLVL